ncbi:MAG: AAA family ATPase [Bacteroidales bacterium]|nr:AAA family ATPase [Bacteroidales bacterium]MBR7034805.1 AAA family ATPase [Bacteroidales bacterium]
MLHDYVEKQMLAHFSFVPTDDQKVAFKELAKFITSDAEVFIMNGYAGTGKTTLVRSLIETLQALETPYFLLAPTGRSAKVLSNYTKSTALTIHKKIYRQRGVHDGIQSFGMSFNAAQNVVYIVDEASMLSDTTGENTIFGSGSVLNDLFRFIFNEHNCKLLLIGDTAQLPPIGSAESPALDANFIERQFLKKANSVTLTQIIRQAQDSGILQNATTIRNLITNDEIALPHIQTYPDVEQIDGSMLLDALESSHNKVGIQDTIVITRTNKLANRYNAGIRSRILWKDTTISKGDYIMIVKNNYFWTEGNKDISFIANGDIAEVIDITKYENLYGFDFAEVTIQFPDYQNIEMTVNVLLNTLTSESASLTYEESNKLYTEVCADYADIKNKRKLYEEVKKNPYFNALQIKFAYAVTCHKAQGGQWKHVYIDHGYFTDEMLNKEFLRWLYTAFTRATEKIYLVNFKDEFFE